MDWTYIVKQYSSIVWATINRLVPEAPDAADCFQATFTSAWQLSRKQTIRNWPALLRQLATARALDRCRELARHRTRHEELPAEGVIDKRLIDPSCNAEATELEEMLRTALADINPREAEVFCLACLEELTYQEIGSQLDITVNHVGVILNRARLQLRSKLMLSVSTSNAKAKDNAR